MQSDNGSGQLNANMEESGKRVDGRLPIYAIMEQTVFDALGM
jgi:hypothetical protein